MLIVETGRSGHVRYPFYHKVYTMVAVVITAPIHKSPLFLFNVVVMYILWRCRFCIALAGRGLEEVGG